MGAAAADTLETFLHFKRNSHAIKKKEKRKKSTQQKKMVGKKKTQNKSGRSWK